jgi:hypothetical protein
MKKYIGPILTVTSLAMLFITMLHLKEQNKQLPVLQHQVDSLQKVINAHKPS